MVSSMNRDITEQIFFNLDTGMLRVRFDKEDYCRRHVIAFNTKIAKILKTDFAILKKKYDEDSDFYIYEKDREWFRLQMKQVRDQVKETVEEKDAIPFQYRVIDSMGKVHWMESAVIGIETDKENTDYLFQCRDITSHMEGRKRYEKQKVIAQALINEALASVTFNLTKNTVSNTVSSVPYMKKILENGNVNEVCEAISDSVLGKEKQDIFRKYFNRENILDNYKKGIYHKRVKFVEGKTGRWLEGRYDLLKNPSSKDIEAIVMVKDINDSEMSKLVLLNVARKEYKMIGVVNKETRGFYYIKNVGYEDSPVFHCNDYDFVIKKYAENQKDLFLTPLDYNKVRKQSSLSNVIKQLDETDIFELCIQMKGKNKEGMESYAVSFWYIDDNRQQIIVAKKNVTEIVKNDIRQQREILNALEEAREANAAQSDFLSRMSHDLRTPLNAIIGISSLLLEDNKMTDSQKRDLGYIHRSGQFMLGLVNDILDMNRIENGKIDLHYQAYDQSDFVRDMETMFVPLCKEKNIAFVMEPGDDAHTIYTDPLRLKQIFFNLLSNAVKYTKQGGTVIYRVVNREIKDKTEMVTFEIEDNGIGMSEEFQKHMYEPFAKEKNDYIQQYGGSGLGLPIAKNIVEEMGGEIFCKSILNHGTTFTVILPLKIIENTPNEKLTEKVSYAKLSGCNVLVVEDHEINAILAVRLLQKQNMKADCVENGEKAVEKLNEMPEGYYDIVLMDIRMPKMDGIEAAKLIRKSKRKDIADIPIIAMTANALSEDIKMAEKAGMNGYVTKPIHPSDFYQVIAKHIKN